MKTKASEKKTLNSFSISVQESWVDLTLHFQVFRSMKNAILSYLFGFAGCEVLFLGA